MSEDVKSSSQEVQNIDIVNKNLVETNVKFLGDQTTITQVVQLLAYIRHAIKYNMQTEILLKIGQKIINTPFAMTVNDQEISDYITQPEVEIN